MKKILTLAAVAMFAGFASMLAFGVNGNAYIDPSVTTYLIQAIAGLVVAVGAFLAVYWRKAKKKMQDKLGIDENRNKEVESDEIVVKAEEKAEAIVDQAEEKVEELAGQAEEKAEEITAEAEE